MKDLDWGWWQRSAADAEQLRTVVADWMEQEGQSGWARWFRTEMDDRARVERFFGVESLRFVPGPTTTTSRRVLVGAIPVQAPSTGFSGPWFRTLHVVVEEANNVPDVPELAEVPCMALLRHLVVHGDPMDASGGPGRVPFTAFAPLASGLEGIWMLVRRIDPTGLEGLGRLERLGAPMGPGDWRHPRVRALHTSVPDECGRIDLPALRRLDLEDEDGDVPRLLAQVPSVEVLEIDGPLSEHVERAHRAGQLPRLRQVRVWGAPPDLAAVSVERCGPTSRQSIRMTSDWIFDRAIRVRVGPTP